MGMTCAILKSQKKTAIQAKWIAVVWRGCINSDCLFENAHAIVPLRICTFASLAKGHGGENPWKVRGSVSQPLYGIRKNPACGRGLIYR